ncbi:condensin-2 complex subunit g2-like [Plakobranchus ocellatus]|uniref:Condensin-2 complex subunit g2-like n=1 Tax=Plakobranchus ocellatus TaxID=259542 RepID=A0AAV4CG38_9GAST|nr:condensin-2 complex subunit g2-like [Plakobranchus ocellatus]
MQMTQFVWSGKLSEGKNSAHSDGEDDDDDENTNPAEQQQHLQQVTDILRGLTEAIYLMYISLSPILASSAEYRAMGEGLAKKLSVTVREVMAVSQDPDLDSSLIALAGHLPSKTLPLASQSLINRLRKLKPGPQGTRSLTSTVKALVQWEKANLLIEMVREAFEKILSEERHGNSGERGFEEATGRESKPKVGTKEKTKKKAVGFSAAAAEEPCLSWDVAVQVLELMLVQSECRPILLSRYSSSLMSLARTMRPVLARLRHALSPVCEESREPGDLDGLSLPNDHPGSVAVSVKLYSIYLRLCAFLCCGAEKNTGGNEEGTRSGGEADQVREEAHRAVVTAVTWSSTCVLSWLKSASSLQEGNKNSDEAHRSDVKNRKGKEDLAETAKCSQRNEALHQLLTVCLKMASGMMMAGCAGIPLLDEVIQLCMTLIKSLDSEKIILDACVLKSTLSCVYQLLSLRPKPAEGQPPQEEATGRQASREDSAIDKDRYAKIACSCICLLLKTLAPPSSSFLSIGHSGEEVTPTADEATGKAGEHSTEYTKISPSQKNIKADLIKSITALITELISELTRFGRPANICQQTVAAALVCVLSDAARASEREDEGMELDKLQLPCLGAAVLTAVRKRQGVFRVWLSFRMFCAEIENHLKPEQSFTIHEMQALLAVVITVQSYDKAILSPDSYSHLRALATRAARPPAMDEDVFGDLKSKMDKAIRKLASEVISVN